MFRTYTNDKIPLKSKNDLLLVNIVKVSEVDFKEMRHCPQGREEVFNYRHIFLLIFNWIRCESTNVGNN